MTHHGRLAPPSSNIEVQRRRAGGTGHVLPRRPEVDAACNDLITKAGGVIRSYSYESYTCDCRHCPALQHNRGQFRLRITGVSKKALKTRRLNSTSATTDIDMLFRTSRLSGRMSFIEMAIQGRRGAANWRTMGRC